MLLKWLSTRLARVGLACSLVAITVLALMPAKAVPITSGWDKLDHWTAFFMLSLLLNHAYPRRPFWQIAIAVVAYGVGIELVQSLTPDRDADVMDVLADSIGIVIYGLILFASTVLNRARTNTP